MSYCRWSSDCFRSDVYVIAHVDGTWTTYIAMSKRIEPWTGEDPYSYTWMKKCDTEEYKQLYLAFQEWLATSRKVNIDLPHAGETIKDDTPQACANTLRYLRNLGYHVPDGVIEELDAEEFDPVENANIRAQYEAQVEMVREKIKNKIQPDSSNET